MNIPPSLPPPSSATHSRGDLKNPDVVNVSNIVATIKSKGFQHVYFDFDNTLTSRHTWKDLNITTKESLIPREADSIITDDIKALLNELKQQDVQIYIISRQLKKPYYFNT